MTTEEAYIPQPGDMVKWWKARKNLGTARGVVDYIDEKERMAHCLVVPFSNATRARIRCKKAYDQLILLERPGA